MYIQFPPPSSLALRHTPPTPHISQQFHTHNGNKTAMFSIGINKNDDRSKLLQWERRRKDA